MQGILTVLSQRDRIRPREQERGNMDASLGRDDGSRQATSEREIATTDLARVSTLRKCAAVLFAQRTSCEQHSDQFSARELEHLRFIRWLY
jgi:hypothetical protein